MKLEILNYEEAKLVLGQHHYLKGLPKSTIQIFGTKHPETQEITSVIVYSKPLASSIWKGIFYKEVNLVELSRLCILDSCEYIASQLISASIKLINADAIISYADTSQGHIGKVYQATNWYYIGPSKRQIEVYLKSDPTKHSRTIYGSRTLDQLMVLHGSDLDFRERSYKLKYLFIKNKKSLNLLKAPILKYPKDINDIFRKYIYCWTNTKTKRKYIGKTSRGITERYSALNPLTGSNSRYFNKSILKYGKDAFNFEILEELAFSTSNEELKIREHYWITKLNTLRPNGYNISNPIDEDVSNSRPDMRGIKRSLSERKKMKENWETQERKKIIAKLVSPEGKLVKINGLLPFIESEPSVSMSDKRNLEALIKKERNHVKGWRLFESKTDLIPFDQWKAPKKEYEYIMTNSRKEHLNKLTKITSKTYWILSPENITIKITNLNSFSSSVGLSNSSLLSVLAGRRNHTLGWRKGDASDIYLEWLDGKLLNPHNINIDSDWFKSISV